MHHERCALLYNLWYQCVILRYRPEAIRGNFFLSQERSREESLPKSNVPPEVTYQSHTVAS